MSNFEVLRSSRARPSPLVVHVPRSVVALPDPWLSEAVLDESVLAKGGTVFADNRSRPYGAVFDNEVATQLARFGRCLILDAHSFPSRALPYEDRALERPDLCLGYDQYHAPESLVTALEHATREAGWSVARRMPFAESCVPLVYYGRDPRVVSVMIEMNRARYIEEGTGRRAASFDAACELAGELVATAVLFEAFRNTFFHARTSGGGLCIRVGDRCPELDALLEGERQETWAYVTAHNPKGKLASNDENERAQSRLLHELRERALIFYPGAGEADVGDWPPEPSFLVLGIPEKQAVALAESYGQAAVVVGRRNGSARLLQPA